MSNKKLAVPGAFSAIVAIIACSIWIFPKNKYRDDKRLESEEPSAMPEYVEVRDETRLAPPHERDVVPVAATIPPKASVAIQRFDDQVQCLEVAQASHALARHFNDENWVLNRDAAFEEMNEKKAQLRESQLQTIERLLALIEADGGRCVPDAPAPSAVEFYGNALAAAREGSREAANCYVAGSYPVDASEQALVSQHYQTNAWPLMQEGIAGGNWHMVNLASLVHSGYAQGLLSRAVAPDSTWAYRLAGLRELGAASAEHRLHFAARKDELRPFLSRDQIETSDAWAEQQFERSFKGASDDSESKMLCRI